MNAEHCIFCRILAGESPAKFIYRDELISAFWDVREIAPVHVLLVPNEHLPSLNQAEPKDQMLLGHLLLTAARLAKELRVDKSGYRIMVNTGPDGGQSVYHLHVHLIGGRHLSSHF